MGRKIIGNPKQKSIGAKITEANMQELDELIVRLGLVNRTELVRVALSDLIRRDQENNRYRKSVTNADATDNHTRLNTCPTYRALRDELYDALSRLKQLDVCSSSNCLTQCSELDCPKRRKAEDN